MTYTYNYQNLSIYLTSDAWFGKIGLFIALSFLISFVILLLSYVVTFQNQNNELLSIFECGFATFGEIRHPFDIKYYLVALLFLVFDLELVLLIPWSTTLTSPWLHYWEMYYFFFLLIVGFMYEWGKGALTWLKL